MEKNHIDQVTHFRDNNVKNLQIAELYFWQKSILTNAVTFWRCLGARFYARRNLKSLKKSKDTIFYDLVARLQSRYVVTNPTR